MPNKNNNRAEKIQHYFDTKEYRMCPYGLKKHIRRSDLTAGAKECFFFLLDEATFSGDWSAQISRRDIGFEIKKDEKSISRLLLELEKFGYIIRKKQPGKPSIIYINLPAGAIEDLEQSPTRKKPKAIKRCGTIDHKPHEVNAFDRKTSPQKCEPGMRKNEDTTICNNIYINNNKKLASNDTKKTNVVVDFSLDEKESIIVPSLTASKQNKSPCTSKLDNQKIKANLKQIKTLEQDISFAREQYQAIVASKKDIGFRAMSMALANFKKSNRDLFEVELKISKLRYDNEVIILDWLRSNMPDKQSLNAQEVKTLEAKINIFKWEINNLTEHSSSYLSDKSQLEMKMSAIRDRLQKLKAPKINLSSKSYDYLDGQGERAISPRDRRYVLDGIKHIGINDDDKRYKIANEIAYAVRFDSLKNSKVTGQEITVKHGLNIALKLLSQNNWERPIGMMTGQPARPQPKWWFSANKSTKKNS